MQPIRSLTPALYLSLLIFCGLPNEAFAAQPPASFRSVSEAHEQQLDALHQKAEEAILKNNFLKAVQMYNEIILLEPDDETAYTGLGQCYLVLGNFDKAKSAYLNALHINPGNETAYLGLQKIEDPDSLSYADEARNLSDSPAINPPETLAAQTQESQGARSKALPADVPLMSREQTIQTALKNAGLYTGPVDGLIGPATQKAIRDFQSRHEIKVDGKAGPQTIALLQPYLHPESFDQENKQSTPKN